MLTSTDVITPIKLARHVDKVKNEEHMKMKTSEVHITNPAHKIYIYVKRRVVNA
jgi:hypothetical protein